MCKMVECEGQKGMISMASGGFTSMGIQYYISPQQAFLQPPALLTPC